MKIIPSSSLLSQIDGLNSNLRRLEQSASKAKENYDKMFSTSPSFSKALEMSNSSLFVNETLRSSMHFLRKDNFSLANAIAGNQAHLEFAELISGNIGSSKQVDVLRATVAGIGISEVNATFGTSLLLQNSLISQDILGLTDSVKSLLSSPAIDSEILKTIRGSFDIDLLSEIIDRSNLGLLYHGEYIYEDDDLEQVEDIEGDESSIILPEDFLDRFKCVRFIPFQLFEMIKNDPSLMRAITPREFEQFVAELVDKHGFDSIVITPESNDGGRDILATRFENGYPVVYAFECKRYSEENKVGVDIMRALLGSITHAQTQADRGVLITSSSFTRGSNNFIAAEAALSGRDFDDIVGCLRGHSLQL